MTKSRLADQTCGALLALEYLATTNGALHVGHGLTLREIDYLTRQEPRTLENEFRRFIRQRHKLTRQADDDCWL